MLFQRLVCSTLVFTLTTVPVLAQVNLGNSRTPTPVAELRRRANGGDAYAAYILGRDCEGGFGTSGNRPDLQHAIAWYNLAARGGSLQATYRLGQLIAAGKVMLPQPGGGYRADVTQGSAMMQYAVSQGYSPQTNTVISPATTAKQNVSPSHTAPPASSGSNDTAGALLLGLGALAILAIAASSSSSTAGSPSQDTGTGDSQASRTCTIFYDVPITPNPTYPGTTTEQRSRIGHGYECP